MATYFLASLSVGRLKRKGVIRVAVLLQRLVGLLWNRLLTNAGPVKPPTPLSSLAAQTCTGQASGLAYARRTSSCRFLSHHSERALRACLPRAASHPY